jgi:hypothetical protein
MRRTLTAIVGVGILTLAALLGWVFAPGNAQTRPTEPPAAPSSNSKAPNPLPISQVFLFSSGVGYFQREGEVEGNTRVDFTFNGADVNDLLKSLVVDDEGGDRAGSVSYDSPDPVEKTLKSFTLDLTYNPSFAQLINQARGEKVEITLQQGGANQASTLTGVVLGMETQQHSQSRQVTIGTSGLGTDSQQQAHSKEVLQEVDHVNLLCTEGVRSIPLIQVQRLRFLNPNVEADLRHALDVLAARHDAQKKVVSLTFNGEGKRTVKVGYVVENPIWKTSYRLVLNDKGKAVLQGWAVVENTSDDDWKDVRMSLVSGRPISFQMNLYDPLFVPRPSVEPELFASLRPPTFNGAMNVGGQIAGVGAIGGQLAGVNLNFGGQIGGFPAGGGVLLGAGQIGGQIGGMTPVNRYNFGGQIGGIGPMGSASDLSNRLTREEYMKRRLERQEAHQNARNLGSALAAVDVKTEVHSAATAEEVGDYFRYVIDHKITLPRQKSSLLPIVKKPVEARRVSIYNENVQSKFPLLGLRFKNTSGQNLMQGPITVYDAGTYSGDARIADLQPNDERLIAYAVDQGTEVKAEQLPVNEQLTSVKIVKGVIHISDKQRSTKTYTLKNRSPEDRTVVIEHRMQSGWKLLSPEKPSEQTRDMYRFEVPVPSGKLVKHDVVEEQMRTDHTMVSATSGDTIRLLLNSPVPSAAVKKALERAMVWQGMLNDTSNELRSLREKLQEAKTEQSRVREALASLPRDSEPHKRYLKKVETLEDAIERYEGNIGMLWETFTSQQKEHLAFLGGLNAE